MQQPIKFDEGYFPETPTATDSSGSEDSTPPESPMSLEDYFGITRKQAEQKVIKNFSLPPLQNDYFNKQDARVTISNPQFNSDTIKYSGWCGNIRWIYKIYQRRQRCKC